MTNFNSRQGPGIEDPARIQKDLEVQLKFERLLTDISARFVSLSSDQLDNEIKAAQRQICECLDIDLCALWQISSDHPDALLMTHVHVPQDFPLPVPETLNAKESFPWCLEKLVRKEIIVVPRMSDAPAAAAQDRKTWGYFEIEAALTFPLSTGGGPMFGALGFCALKKSRDWSADLVSRLQLVAQIFSSALARKRSEDALRYSEARLKLAADSANAGLWSWDYKTGKIWATEKARLLYGFSSNEEITADKFFKILHPDDRKRVSLIVEKIFREGKSFKIEYRIMMPNQSIRWMAAQAQAFMSPIGEPGRMMGVSIDISQQIRNEANLLELRSELAHLTRVMTMNELSTSLAHEINQPLGAILNNASAGRLLMSQSKDKQQDLGDILEDIIKDAKRAGDVVRKIRGAVKKEDAQIKPLDMNTLIDEVVALFQNSISLNKVLLVMNLEPHLSKVRGDRIRLQQVLMNLILNAMEAMKESDSRTLTIRSFMQAPGRVSVSISDSGTGVDASKKEKVFEPFFTTKKDGLGMGLRICRSIIEEHGGRIWTENNPSGGAMFSFFLEADQGEPA